MASYAGSLAQIMSYFSETFGPLGNQQAGAPSLTIAQLPDGSLAGYSAPGLLLISARQWTSKANDRILSQLAAGQWWGDRVCPPPVPTSGSPTGYRATPKPCTRSNPAASPS